MPDTAPIPLIVLTGFLGAGKTTLLNRLLTDPSIRERNPALIINEFGPAGIDGRLVPRGEEARYEINRGSLFCICTTAEVMAALKELTESIRPGVVLVEATGVAETRDLESMVAEPFLDDRVTVRANVCLVDAPRFVTLAANMKTAVEQVRWADGIVVNKIDRASEGELAQLRAVLDELNPDAPRVEVTYGQVPDGFIDSLEHTPRDGGPTEAPPPDIHAVSIEDAGPVNREAFMARLEAMADRKSTRLNSSHYS